MSPRAIQMAGQAVDLTDRVVVSTAVVASPALAAETIICQVTAPADLRADAKIIVFGFAAYTVGTSGSAVQLRVRQTSVTGTVIANTGAMTGSQHGAGILSSDSVYGQDTAPAVTGQVYVLTMQVTAGAAVSTVSATLLEALVV